MRVWIDQHLCIGDGLCTDHCREVFMLLEDGMFSVREAWRLSPTGPGQRLSILPVAGAPESNVIDAASNVPASRSSWRRTRPTTVLGAHGKSFGR
jgi:ferredoxin